MYCRALGRSKERPYLILTLADEHQHIDSPVDTASWTACTLRSSFRGTTCWTASNLCILLGGHHLLEEMYHAQLIATLVHILCLT